MFEIVAWVHPAAFASCSCVMLVCLRTISNRVGAQEDVSVIFLLTSFRFTIFARVSFLGESNYIRPSYFYQGVKKSIFLTRLSGDWLPAFLSLLYIGRKRPALISREESLIIIKHRERNKRNATGL